MLQSPPERGKSGSLVDVHISGCGLGALRTKFRREFGRLLAAYGSFRQDDRGAKIFIADFSLIV
jgi:hypothetical protein